MAGKLTAVVGPMGSGKTKKLIDTYTSLTEQGLTVSVFKPQLDTRGQINAVYSRDGRTLPAEPVQSLEEVIEITYDFPCDVVLIDEIQFFGYGAYEALEELILADIDVYVFGLDITSENETFGEMGNILAHADEVIKLTTSCKKCGKPARISHYKGNDKNATIKIGDLDSYEPLCRYCYNEEMEQKFEAGVENIQLYGNNEIYYAVVNLGSCTVTLALDQEALAEAGYTLEQVQDINSPQGFINLIEDLSKAGGWGD